MKLVSVNEISKLTGATRETVGKKLASLTPQTGPKNAKLYPSDKALRLVMGLNNDGEERIDYAEAQRRLAVAREAQIRLEMEVLDKQRPKLEDINEAMEALFRNIAGIIKTSGLTEERQNDIFTLLRELPLQIKP